LELNPIASCIGKTALYENAIPLSVFTHALSDKLLKNQIIFDSSLETIQQFEIVMVSCRIKFNHFEGDQSTYRLRCKRCNNIILGYHPVPEAPETLLPSFTTPLSNHISKPLHQAVNTSLYTTTRCLRHRSSPPPPFTSPISNHISKPLHQAVNTSLYTTFLV
jgi:hypothetical protein